MKQPVPIFVKGVKRQLIFLQGIALKPEYLPRLSIPLLFLDINGYLLQMIHKCNLMGQRPCFPTKNIIQRKWFAQNTTFCAKGGVDQSPREMLFETEAEKSLHRNGLRPAKIRRGLKWTLEVVNHLERIILCRVITGLFTMCFLWRAPLVQYDKLVLDSWYYHL